MGLDIRLEGTFKDIERYLQRNRIANILSIMRVYGDMGNIALASATPSDTGKTAMSWRYVIGPTNTGYSITWYNDNYADRVPVVILLQYGHATYGGGYVDGLDFINPALVPIFEQLAEALWKEVRR